MLGGTVQDITLPTDLNNLRLQFLELTGYSSNDLLAFNADTRLFYTRNGGLYHLPVSGEIEHIKGPSPDPEDRI